MSSAGGYLENPESASACQFCSIRTTDQFLASGFNIIYGHRWRNFGIMMAFVVFNVSADIFRSLAHKTEFRADFLHLYYHVPVPHPDGKLIAFLQEARFQGLSLFIFIIEGARQSSSPQESR